MHRLAGSRRERLGGQTAQPMMTKTTSKPAYTLRRLWSQVTVELERSLFAAKQDVIPQCRVSVGSARSGVRSSHIAQCWSPDVGPAPHPYPYRLIKPFGHRDELGLGARRFRRGKRESHLLSGSVRL